MLSIFMFSCQKDALEPEVHTEPEPDMTRANYTQLQDLMDKPVYIYLQAGQAAPEARYLTCHSSNGSVLLFRKEASQGGKQQWTLTCSGEFDPAKIVIHNRQGDSQGRFKLVTTPRNNTERQLGVQNYYATGHLNWYIHAEGGPPTNLPWGWVMESLDSHLSLWKYNDGNIKAWVKGRGNGCSHFIIEPVPENEIF